MQRSLGLGYKLCTVIPVAGQRTDARDYFSGAISQVATAGAECAVSDCLVDVVQRKCYACRDEDDWTVTTEANTISTEEQDNI